VPNEIVTCKNGSLTNTLGVTVVLGIVLDTYRLTTYTVLGPCILRIFYEVLELVTVL